MMEIYNNLPIDIKYLIVRIYYKLEKKKILKYGKKITKNIMLK